MKSFDLSNSKTWLSNPNFHSPFATLGAGTQEQYIFPKLLYIILN
jgi:hypothetical protein